MIIMILVFSEPDVETQLKQFEANFSNLQASVEEELIRRNKTVESVSAKLRGLPPRMKKDYNKYIKELSQQQSQKPNTLEELFVYLNEYCWNCFEYELLEFVIKSNNCSMKLVNRMDNYDSDVKRFKRNTTISVFLKYSQYFGPKLPRHYDRSKLRTKYDIDPDQETLHSLDRLPEDIWNSDSKLSECIMQVYRIIKGCVEIEWIISEEYDYDMMTFFCSEVGKEILERHQITKVYINDLLIDNSVRHTISCSDTVSTIPSPVNHELLEYAKHHIFLGGVA